MSTRKGSHHWASAFLFLQEVIALANKPMRPCRHPGCHVLTVSGYCDKHRPRGDRRSEASKSWRWMYGTDVWLKDLRPMQLMRQPWCSECAKRGVRTRATDVDHIVDHRGDWELFTDRGNLQSLCHSCHSRKTAAEIYRRRRGNG